MEMFTPFKLGETDFDDEQCSRRSQRTSAYRSLHIPLRRDDVADAVQPDFSVTVVQHETRLKAKRSLGFLYFLFAVQDAYIACLVTLQHSQHLFLPSTLLPPFIHWFIHSSVTTTTISMNLAAWLTRTAWIPSCKFLQTSSLVRRKFWDQFLTTVTLAQ